MRERAGGGGGDKGKGEKKPLKLSKARQEKD
jgi:hypothetical protein